MKKVLVVALAMAILSVFSIAQEKTTKPHQKKAKSTECCAEMKECGKECGSGSGCGEKAKSSESKTEKSSKDAKKEVKPETKKPS